MGRWCHLVSITGYCIESNRNRIVADLSYQKILYFPCTCTCLLSGSSGTLFNVLLFNMKVKFSPQSMFPMSVWPFLNTQPLKFKWFKITTSLLYVRFRLILKYSCFIASCSSNFQINTPPFIPADKTLSAKWPRNRLYPNKPSYCKYNKCIYNNSNTHYHKENSVIIQKQVKTGSYQLVHQS